MPSRIDALTSEQTTRFGEWRRKWIGIGLSTEPADFEAASAAALACYDLIGRKRPTVILRMGSPFGACIGGPLAIAVLKGLALRGQQVEQQVRQQVGQQVEQQVWQQVRQQVGQQVEQQVEQQVWQQVEQQVWQQVRQQVWQQVRQQVWQQVWQQVGQQVGQQVEEQVWQQVEEQVGQQVGQQVWQQVWQQVGQQVGDAVWNNSSSYGLWAGWMSWVSFFRDVCRWEDDALSRFALAEALANTGWQWWHSDVLALSDRPRFIKRNAAGRLHSDEGPAIEYRDGWSIYAWHGYRLPDTHYHLITARDKITPAMIEAEPNAELRRIALEIFGFDRFFEARGGKVIDKDEVFGRPRRLLELKLKGEKIRVMDVYNGSLEPDGTRRRFMLGAVAGVNTVHEAVAASYGLNPGAYREAVRT